MDFKVAGTRSGITAIQVDPNRTDSSLFFGGRNLSPMTHLQLPGWTTLMCFFHTPFIVQADIKLEGLPLDVVLEAVDVGVDAQARILDIMDATLSAPRATRKENAPLLETLTLPPEKSRTLYKDGGIKVKQLTAETGAFIARDVLSSLFSFTLKQSGLPGHKDHCLLRSRQRLNLCGNTRRLPRATRHVDRRAAGAAGHRLGQVVRAKPGGFGRSEGVHR